MSKLKINLVFSTLSQIFYFIIPLLLIPKLTNTLGLAGYGKIILIQAYVAMGTTLIDWSHSWGATKEIASTVSKSAREEIFITVWTSQLFLAFLAMLITIAYSIFDVNGPAHGKYVIIIFILFFGYVLFPTWMYQAIEDLKYSSLLTIAQRLILICCTFIFVRTADDVDVFLLLTALTQLIIGFLSLMRLNYLGYSIKPIFKLRLVFFTLKKSYALFLTRLTISLYTTLVPIIISKIGFDGDVAIYGLADRIRVAAQSAISPVTQTLFPRLSNLFATDVRSARRLLIISSLFLIGISLVISLALYLFSDRIIYFFGGNKFEGASLILKILSPLPLIISISNILGVQIMLPKGMQRYFSRVIVACSFFGLPVICAFVYLEGGVGAAEGAFIVESAVALLMAYIIFKKCDDIFI